jgi:hypothetical protein
MAVTSSCYPTMCETTRARGTRANIWPDTLCFITTSGSIRRWAIARRQRCTWGEPSAILMVDIWLGRAQVAKSLSPLTYVAPKMVLTMGSTSFLPQLISLVSGLITALVGYALLRSAGTARREIIPRQDATLLYQLLLEKNHVALSNYIKLASLSGFVGFCTSNRSRGCPK